MVRKCPLYATIARRIDLEIIQKMGQIERGGLISYTVTCSPTVIHRFILVASKGDRNTVEYIRNFLSTHGKFVNLRSSEVQRTLLH